MPDLNDCDGGYGQVDPFQGTGSSAGYGASAQEPQSNGVPAYRPMRSNPYHQYAPLSPQQAGAANVMRTAQGVDAGQIESEHGPVNMPKLPNDYDSQYGRYDLRTTADDDDMLGSAFNPVGQQADATVSGRHLNSQSAAFADAVSSFQQSRQYSSRAPQSVGYSAPMPAPFDSQAPSPDHAPSQNPFAQNAGELGSAPQPPMGGSGFNGRPPFPPAGGQQPIPQPQRPSPNGEPASWQPWYGIDFKNAVVRYFKKYATFNGRASRSEYWLSYLFLFVTSSVLSVLSDAVSDDSPLALVIGAVALAFGLATIVPSISIAVRRAHDANKSGYVVLGYTLTSLAGVVVLLGGLFAAAGSMLGAAFTGMPSGSAGVLGTALGGSVIAMLVGFVIILVAGIWALIVNVSKPDPAGARFDKPM